MKNQDDREKLEADKVLKETADVYAAGTLQERYACYVASGHDNPPKSFQEWMEN